MTKIANALMICGAMLGGSAHAQQTQDHAAHAAVAGAEMGLTDGEVRKVDKDAGKITIRHGAIENLGMPPMTMVFQVKDATALDRLKIGDKIRFAAEKSEGAFVVTQVVPAQ